MTVVSDCEAQRRLDRCLWAAPFKPHRTVLERRVYARTKRAMDVCIVVASAPVVIVLVALCAVTLKIESPRSPIFFRQLRTGRGGRRFSIVKLRTMVDDAEQLKARLAAQNELTWPDFKLSRDPRVTTVGRYLRKTSLDELPQLWNVLRGDMSLVGPRPTFFDTTTYLMWQTERLDVPPGLTGLWQLLARSEVSFNDRARLDIAYVHRRCLTLDLLILLLTVPVLFGGARGAR